MTRWPTCSSRSRAWFYDILDPDRSDLDVYVAVAAEFETRSVLDIGCGTGTLACMLAERGIEVMAVDPARTTDGDGVRRSPTWDNRVMETTEISVATGSSQAVVDLTAEVHRFTRDKGDGLLSVFVPHATAGVAVIEVGSGSDRDLLAAIDDILPPTDGRWAHRHGSPGHGRDHVLPAWIAPSITIPVVEGVPTLGTWQSVVLVDTNVDNHTRRVRLSFIPG